MNNQLFYKKLLRFIIFIIIGLLLYITALKGVSFIFNESLMSSIKQEFPEEDKAFTDVNLTLFEDTFIYERQTNFDLSEGPEEVRRSFVVATLTTHSDLMLNFNAEFYAGQWEDNLTLFKNSSKVQNYRTFQPLKQLVPDVDNISLLEITRSSLRIFYANETFLPTNFFVIEQTVILRQTTTFILALHEIFQFDRNKIELSQITDFNFQSEYQNFDGEGLKHSFESIRIKAPSTILDYVTSKKGYTGRIYLSDWEDPEPVPPYVRGGFGHIPQDIRMSITFPIGQKEISYKFDTNFTQEVSISDLDIIKKQNTITMLFTSESYLPFYLDLDTATPFLEQFSLSDYLSMAVGGLAGLFTFFKGLPYYLNRRSFNKYKKALHLASEKGSTSDFERIQSEIKEKFVQRKISARQLEEIKKEIQFLSKTESIKKLQTKEEDKAPSLEELLGRNSS